MIEHFSKKLSSTLTDEAIKARVSASVFTNFFDEKIQVKAIHSVLLFKLPTWFYHWIALDGLYVWSDYRKIPHGPGGKAFRDVGNTWKSIFLGSRKRRSVSLNENPKQKKERIAVLVARVVYGPRPEGLEVCHKNDDVSTDHYSKLYYGTRLENAGEAVQNEKYIVGVSHHSAKMTDEKVRDVRLRHKNGEAGGELAKEFQLHPKTMSAILSGDTWRHVL